MSIIKFLSSLTIAWLMVLLHGCASAPSEPGMAPSEREAPTPSASPFEPKAQPAETAPQPSAAVVALLEEADQQMDEGQVARAAASLERALRIEPENPVLWQRLAAIRLEQERPAQAETLARKSNTLAGDNKALQSFNWRLIAEARLQQGDQQGYERAMQRSLELSGR